MPLYFEPEGRDKTEKKPLFLAEVVSLTYTIVGGYINHTYIANLIASKGQWRHVVNLII